MGRSYCRENFDPITTDAKNFDPITTEGVGP
jgi:hypothetical protein